MSPPANEDRKGAWVRGDGRQGFCVHFTYAWSAQRRTEMWGLSHKRLGTPLHKYIQGGLLITAAGLRIPNTDSEQACSRGEPTRPQAFGREAGGVGRPGAKRSR